MIRVTVFFSNVGLVVVLSNRLMGLILGPKLYLCGAKTTIHEAFTDGRYPESVS